MSKTPTEFEAEELLYELRKHGNDGASWRVLCQTMDIRRKDFQPLLRKARELADERGLLILHDGNESYKLVRSLKR